MWVAQLSEFFSMQELQGGGFFGCVYFLLDQFSWYLKRKLDVVMK